MPFTVSPTSNCPILHHAAPFSSTPPLTTLTLTLLLLPMEALPTSSSWLTFSLSTLILSADLPLDLFPARSSPLERRPSSPFPLKVFTSTSWKKDKMLKFLFPLALPWLVIDPLSLTSTEPTMVTLILSSILLRFPSPDSPVELLSSSSSVSSIVSLPSVLTQLPLWLILPTTKLS